MNIVYSNFQKNLFEFEMSFAMVSGKGETATREKKSKDE